MISSTEASTILYPAENSRIKKISAALEMSRGPEEMMGEDEQLLRDNEQSSLRLRRKQAYEMMEPHQMN